MRVEFQALVQRAEIASITPVLRDKHRLSGRQSGHRKKRFIRMMSWEIQGLGTKEWATRVAPFFACVFCVYRLQISLRPCFRQFRVCRKVKTRARRVFV